MSREGLAGLAGMNHDYFGKMFLIYTGKKVGIYIGELRVRKAADELASTRRSIVDIAFSSGFESLSTFYRIFQAVTGLSPSAYRNRFRKREPR
ncbi:MAG TPA: helix-turn-helix transcriptional regulator [Spirochaetota bacterium]|nr:helix-turn-helix transcriptional regulator [Spirochaetota bacterium]